MVLYGLSMCSTFPPLLFVVASEGWVGREASAPDYSGYSGTECLLWSQVQRGEGFTWGRGARAWLRERKEDRRVVQVW